MNISAGSNGGWPDHICHPQDGKQAWWRGHKEVKHNPRTPVKARQAQEDGAIFCTT